VPVFAYKAELIVKRTLITKHIEGKSMQPGPLILLYRLCGCYCGSRWLLLASVLLFCLPATQLRAVDYYSRGVATQMTRSSNEVIVELDGARAPAEVSADLEAAGFSSLEEIEGMPGRYSYHRLSVDVNDAEALATIRSIEGIRVVRYTYRMARLDVPLIHTGKSVVKFKPGTTYSQVNAIAAEYGATIDRQLLGLPQVYILRKNDESVTDAVEMAALMYGHSRTVYSHPSFFMKDLLEYHQVQIDDPLYPFQWHLNNTGQLDRGVFDADVDAPEAWEITQGAGALIGVIDSAMHWEHEDLIGNYFTGFDYFDNDGDPTPGIALGGLTAHGTAVTGIICASGNDVGLRGVAPEAQWIGCRMTGLFMVTFEDMAESFLFCERNGAMAINNSWGPVTGWLPVVPPGGIFLPDVVSDAIVEVSTNGRSGKGTLVLFSSGNSGVLVNYDNMYAALPNTMAIGATLRNDLITCYSSFGPNQSVVAPGGGVDTARSIWGGTQGLWSCFIADIATTDIDESFGLVDQTFFLGATIFGFNPPTKFVGFIRVPDPEVIDFPNTAYTHQMNGTSSACPVTAGVAALVFSINNNLTAREARNLIEHTADKIAIPNERFDGVTGHNSHYGHGRVNAYTAVLAAQAGKSWPSPVEDVDSLGSQGYALLNWENPDWDADDIIDSDVAGVLIVRAPVGQLDWHPSDGIAYTVGQQVAPGVMVVANDLIDKLEQTGVPAGEFGYGLYVRNGSDYYSWGRRTRVTSSGAVSVPLASIQASPKVGPAPLKVHFAGGGIDEAGLVSFLWDFGDGMTATGATIDHTYTAAGEYTARLTVTNQVGQSATASVYIIVSAKESIPPNVVITASPNSGAAPLVVLFEATVTDEFGMIIDDSFLRYDWDFDDGTSASSRVVEHVYINPGTYGVTLGVIDQNFAVGMASTLVKVEGGGMTAAQTEPSEVLNTGLPNCASGVPAAVVMSFVGLLGLWLIRRRR
jgi:uncharacterized protein (TIGR03382 family)